MSPEVAREARNGEDQSPRRFNTSDPDIVGSFAALKRAARAARKLAEETGTPFYVWQNGRVVNLNPNPKAKRRATKRA